MIPALPGLDDLFGWVVDTAASTVFDGIVSWMARGLAVLIEWVWSTLDTATTPRITEPWFATDLMGPVSLLALAVVVALMLASGIQAALAGRPEQVVDAFRQGGWAVAATALVVTVVDVLLGVVDAASAGIWSTVRPDLQRLLEGVVVTMSAGSVVGLGFLAVLMLLFLYLAMLGLAVTLAMRNALIYVTALLAPIVFASSVLPLFRDSARKVVHLAVALVVSKLAIVATLALAVKMMGNAPAVTATGDPLADGAASLGVLFAGVVCFAVASFTPVVLYRLMPTVEGAAAASGIAGGWARGATGAVYAASGARALGGGPARLATTAIPAAASPPGTGGAGGPGGGSAGGGAASKPIPPGPDRPDRSGGTASPAGRGAGGGGGHTAAAAATPPRGAAAGGPDEGRSPTTPGGTTTRAAGPAPMPAVPPPPSGGVGSGSPATSSIPGDGGR